MLGILPVKGFTCGWASDFCVDVIVAIGLTCINNFKIFGIAGIAHQPDIVINADGVALRAVTGGIIGGISHFRVAALSASAMHVYPGAAHIAHRPAKIDVHGIRAGR